MPSQVSSECVTNGIRILVRPSYSQEHSNPDQERYVYTYHVTITNESEQIVQLLSRYWLIINSEGDREEVRGPGVIGLQPVIEPGESFEYNSFCPLDTDFGTMEGSYTFIDSQRQTFDVKIGRFYLTVQQTVEETN